MTVASILGSEETINGLTRDMITAYKHSHYRPDDIIISAAGNVSHDTLVSLVNAEFSAVSSRWKPDGLCFRPAGGRHVTLIERDLEQTQICMGTRALQQDHPDRYALHLLATVLGGGMSSRLFQEVREKKGLAYAVYSYVISHADSGSLVVYAGTEQKHCREVIDIVLAEMLKLKQEAVSQTELDSAREQLKGKLLMSLESSENLMTRLAKNLIFMGRHQPVENILEGFDAVGIQDVNELAGQLFDGECLNLQVMGKVSGLEITADSLEF